MIYIEKVLKSKYPDYQIMWSILALCVLKSKEYISIYMLFLYINRIRDTVGCSTPSPMMSIVNDFSYILKTCPLFVLYI